MPLRVTRYELREDAVAAGRWRGVLTWGFRGGADGRTSYLQLIREGQQPVELPSMMATIPVSKGDKIRAVGGIGGGYGKPAERPPERVLEDVLDGVLTREAAARDFGIVIDG